MSIDFDNPLTAGTVLVREQIQSQNYDPGVAGWVIKANGDAEFNDVVIRGGTVVSGVALYYDGTPAAGNLIMSVAAASGTDAYGNDYRSGVTVYDPSAGSAVQLDAGAGASLLNFDPPDVTGVTWANGYVAVGTGSRLGTNTPVLSLASPYNTSPSASQSSIQLFGRPETAAGSTTNEVFMSTQRVWITGDANVVGVLTAGNEDEGSVTAALSAASSVDVTVTFNKTFPAAPKVVASLVGNPTLPAGSSALIARPFNITTTGCQIRVNDVGGVARTLNHRVDWIAKSS